jgi:hypothetical protein
MLMPPGGPFDGSAVEAITGTALVHTFLSSHSGYVAANFSLPDGRDISVRWTDFHEQPNAAWQTGGIAANVVEHGASGHGNKMEPQVDLLSGGWGTAELLQDGQPIVDPISGTTNWSAHYMITKEGIMDPKTHAVYKADKTTPFDPSSPGDGYVIPGRTELHIGFWTAGAFKNGIFQKAAPANATPLTDTVTGATYDKQWPIPAELGAKITIDASMSGAGKLTFTLKDPKGQPVAQLNATPLSAGSLGVAKAEAGNYTLDVQGAGVQAAYHAAVTVDDPAPEWIHIVFEDVRFGD